VTREIERQEQEARRREQEERMVLDEEERRRLVEERRVQREREIEEDRRNFRNNLQRSQERTGSATFRLKCFSFAFSNRTNISENSDKILLPQSILNLIETNRVAFPITLELKPIGENNNNNLMDVDANPDQTMNESNNDNVATVDMKEGQGVSNMNDNMTVEQLLANNNNANTNHSQNQHVTHASVLDFTAPENTAYLPYRMLKKLGIEEGIEIDFRTVSLPKAEFAKLQPHKMKWLEIPETDRKSILENHLRTYQTLTENDVIGVEYDNFMYEFDVIAVQPQKAVSILDSDVSVDILEPLELQKIFHTEVNFGETKPFNLKKGEYAYFQVKVNDPSTHLNIKLAFEEGTAEFYISNTRKYPTSATRIWTSDPNYIPSNPNQAKVFFNPYDGSKSIVISDEDPLFQLGWHYIALHCDIAESCKGSLTIKNAKSEQSLRNSEISLAEGMKQCPHCLKTVSDLTFLMHTTQCARRNIVCEVCRQVIPVADIQQHKQVTHSRMKCECGYEGEFMLILVHKQYECKYRPYKCPYCEVTVPMNDRASHLRMCGSRTTQCPYCNSNVKYSDLQVHQAANHPEFFQEANQTSNDASPAM
jgi:hypothetical protein